MICLENISFLVVGVFPQETFQKIDFSLFVHIFLSLIVFSELVVEKSGLESID